MLSTDRNSFFFGVGAIVVTLGVGMCSTNGRFDDLNGRIDALNADVNQRIDALNADVDQRIDALNADVDQRIDALNADVNRRFDGVDQRIDEVGADIRGLRADVNGIDERLRAVEVAFGRVDQRLLTIERVVLPPESPGG